MIDVDEEEREERDRRTEMTTEKLYCRWAEGGHGQPVICLCQMKERIFFSPSDNPEI